MTRRHVLRKALEALAGLALGGCAGRPGLGGRREPARPSRTDWPVYRHDTALSGVSPGVGRITSPHVRWEHYLGAPVHAVATTGPRPDPFVADLDGDGRLERFVLAGRTIEITDLEGRRLWRHTLSGRPLGAHVRICSLYPDRPGLQIVSFGHRMDTGEGQGYCFGFERGAERGELLWTTGPLAGYHAPTLIVDDVDGDSLPEIVTAPHHRIQIFDGQTGTLKADVPWRVGRNYGMLLARPRAGLSHKSIYVIADFAVHVNCIRHEDGHWRRAWGHRYLADENAPTPRGREQYLRVGPNPVEDLDGDGRDELVYMLIEARTDDRWHLRIRDAENGRLRLDAAGIWLWSVADVNGDGRPELVYTATPDKRPASHSEVRIGRFDGERLVDLATIEAARPILMQAALPLSAHSIADEGLLDLLRVDLDGDGLPELFYTRRTGSAQLDDALHAVSLGPDGVPVLKWSLVRAGHHLNVVHAGLDGAIGPVVRVRDLSASRALTVDAAGTITADRALGRPTGFTTTPIVVDLDGDGRNEIVVQTAAAEIVALRPGRARGDPPEILWSVPGVAMNPSPGYAWNGPLSPQAADVDGDGRPEVVFASEDEQGRAALECVDGQGRRLWRRPFAGCPWGGLQAGVNLWTFGHFTGRPRGLDVYVDVHRRAKGSSGGYVLRGDSGRVAWYREGLVARNVANAFGGGLPAVADLDENGIDDLIQANWTLYAAIAGDTGTPLHPPAFLPGPSHFGRWIAYASPTVVDLDGDGRPDVYLNSASPSRGGHAAVRADGRPLWATFHDLERGSDGLGPVGDFDGDGSIEIGVPMLDGTLVCLDGKSGARRWALSTPVTGDVVAADVNGDGILELLFAGKDGRLRAVSGRDGHEVWSLPATGRPIVADVDGDGFVEVLAVGEDGVLRIIA